MTPEQLAAIESSSSTTENEAGFKSFAKKAGRVAISVGAGVLIKAIDSLWKTESMKDGYLGIPENAIPNK